LAGWAEIVAQDIREATDEKNSGKQGDGFRPHSLRPPRKDWSDIAGHGAKSRQLMLIRRAESARKGRDRLLQHGCIDRPLIRARRPRQVHALDLIGDNAAVVVTLTVNGQPL